MAWLRAQRAQRSTRASRSLYMLVPIVVIAVFSFGDTPKGKLTFALDDGFTARVLAATPSRSPELNDALVTSLELAALATVISTAIGTLMAIGAGPPPVPRAGGLANLLIVLPMATPEIVIGASLLSMFVYYTFALGFNTLLIAHVMFSISFVVVVVRSRLIGFDRQLEEAAADLGATPLQTFRYVTLPLLAPGVVAAALLAFALSIDDFVISNFNSGTTVTFPLYVFGVALRGIPVQVNVLATMLFLVTVIAIAAGALAAAAGRADGRRCGPMTTPASPPPARVGAAPAPGTAGG